jgi:hypothetical protein
MTMAASLEAALEASNSLSKTVQFIEGGPLVACMTFVGDNSANAAKYALERASTASDRIAAVRSAITHLESAHVAYYEIYEEWVSADAPFTFKGLVRSPGDEWAAARKDIVVLVLLALCDRYVGERANMLRSLEDLKVAYRAWIGPLAFARFHEGDYRFLSRVGVKVEGTVELGRAAFRPFRTWQAGRSVRNVRVPDWNELNAFSDRLRGGPVGPCHLPSPPPSFG